MKKLTSIQILKIMLLIFLLVMYVCGYFDTVVSLVVWCISVNQVTDWAYQLGLKNIYTDYENI